MTREDYGHAYDIYFCKTKNFLLRKGFPYDICDECTQSAWAEGWRCIGKFKGEDQDSSLSSWICGIAYNLANEEVRRKAKRDTLWKKIPQRIQSNSVMNDILFSQIFNLECMSQVNSKILRMYFIEGYRLKEIAEIHGGSESSVSQRLTKAKNKIIEHLKKVA